MYKIALGFSVVCSVFISGVAQARWAEPSEAPVVVNFVHHTYRVRKDGSATVVTESQYEILKDSARASEGLHRFTYDASTTKVKILEAKTINPDGTFDVPKQDREDKPLASRGAGFDLINQITIGFPQVNVGSKLYLKTEETESRATLPGYFFLLRAMWGRSYQTMTVDLESEIPLYLDTYDPEGYLDVQKSEKKIHLELKRPYYKQVLEETNEFFDNRALVWISVSSAKDWSQFPKNTLEAYEKDLSSPLPKTYAAIVEKAQKQKTPIDVINTVTSELASQIRYVGEWKELEGLWHPRALDLITTSGFGDCKDFSTSAGAMLRHLGFNTHIAWVQARHEHEEAPLDDKVLNINHAIVRAEKDGQVYWIDATNPTSEVQSIFSSIANRIVYVLYPEKLSLERTPAIVPSQSEIKIVSKLNFKTWKAEGVADFKGRSAESLTGDELRQDKNAINYNILSWVTERSKALDWSMGHYDLTSRIVRDLSIPFSYTMAPILEQTTSGAGYEIRAPYWIDHFKLRAKDRVADLILATPQVLNREFELTGRDVNLVKKIKCEGDSPWAAYKREITRQPEGIKLTDHLEIKTLIVKVDDLKTEKFKTFQSKILDCMQETIVVFK